MNVGFFGGTFDPIHRGHIALARAAEEKFRLRRIYFVTANVPPHKQKQTLTPFIHRYTMVSLATAGHKNWIPSLLEAPEDRTAGKGTKAGPNYSRPNYSIETIRKLKAGLKKSDRVFFLIGIDAFLEIQKWHQPVRLFEECEFVVASRPGYSLADVANALPKSLRPKTVAARPFRRSPAEGDLLLPGVTVHLLDGVDHAISATAIRAVANTGRACDKMADPAVAEYIRKQGLYRL